MSRHRIKNKKTEAMDGLTSLGYIWFLTFLLFQELLYNIRKFVCLHYCGLTKFVDNE